MKELFPLKPQGEGAAVRERDPKLVGIDEAEADEVFDALSSGTARRVLGNLYEEPATASDLAERVDTSLQNATYHVNKLRDAGLVEVAETWYSAQGREMKVYAPTNGPLVVYAGARASEDGRSLSTALARLFGAVAAVAFVGVLVNALVASTRRDAGAISAATARPSVGVPAGATARHTGIVATVVHSLSTLATSPGGVTFLSGTVLLSVAFLAWYTRRYRPDGVRVA